MEIIKDGKTLHLYRYNKSYGCGGYEIGIVAAENLEDAADKVDSDQSDISELILDEDGTYIFCED